MFVPLCCGLGCFARRPAIMTSLRTPSRRPSKTPRRHLRIHQWKIFIRVHTLDAREGKRLPLRGGEPLAAHEKLQNIK